MNFALFLLLSTIENIDRKTLKGGDEKADWLEFSGPKEQHVVSPLGFLFASYTDL